MKVTNTTSERETLEGNSGAIVYVVRIVDFQSAEASSNLASPTNIIIS